MVGITKPICPSCGKRMTLARTVPRAGGLPPLNVFQCIPCGVVFTEADSKGAIAERALILHDEAYRAIQ